MSAECRVKAEDKEAKEQITHDTAVHNARDGAWLEHAHRATARWTERD